MIMLNKMLGQGNTFFRNNLLDDASNIYKEALERINQLNDDQTFALRHLHLCLLLNLSRSQRKTGDIDKAINVATEAVDKNPVSTEALVTRAKAFKMGNMIPEALEDYSAALRIDPTNKVIYLDYLKLREEWKLQTTKNAFLSQSYDSIVYIDDCVTNCSSI